MIYVNHIMQPLLRENLQGPFWYNRDTLLKYAPECEDVLPVDLCVVFVDGSHKDWRRFAGIFLYLGELKLDESKEHVALVESHLVSLLLVDLQIKHW